MIERRLAAVLATDVVGYSRLMGQNEEGALAALRSLREEILDPAVARHRGRLVKLIGDGTLVEFVSVVDAVNCAYEIQREIVGWNNTRPDDARLELRVGINLGDVMIENDDLYGDGVNVAARLESIAEPGGIMVSEAVAMQTAGKSHVKFEDMGKRRLKNIAEPVRIYRVDLEGGSPTSPSSYRRPAVFTAGSALILLVVGYAIWETTFQPTVADGLVFDQKEILARPTGPTVAVMPFENLSGNADQDILAVGIGEDIVVQLGRYRDLSVLSRQSTYAFQGKVIDTREIGQTLGADFVLEGTVRRTRDRLHVTAQLIEANSRAQVWSDSFIKDSTTSEIFEVQQQITEKVASAIGDAGGAIKRIHAGRARAKSPEKLSSYECSMLRVGFINRREIQKRVRDCILRVVAEEPNYWRGWAQLAEALLTDVKFFTKFYDGTQARKLDRALEAAKKAVSLSPDSPRAHFVLAVVLQLMGDRQGFNAAAEAALGLGGDRYLEGQIGYEFVWSGRLELGAALLHRAIDLDPNAADPNWYQALAEYYFINGEYETALKEYRKGAQPHLWWAVAIEVAILAKLGRSKEAIMARDRLYSLRPKIRISDIVWIYRRFMRPDKLMVPFVEAYRSVGIPEGKYRPLRIDSSG